MKFVSIVLAALMLTLVPLVGAEPLVVKMHLVNEQGVGTPIGTITITNGMGGGLKFTPNLDNLGKSGPLGFHVHEFPDCGAKENAGKMVPGLAAGPHYDPHNTQAHMGPHGHGHLGDLPALEVNNGRATAAVTAKRLDLSHIKGRAVVIHAGPDDYGMNPGGARIACGVVPNT